ncbi:peptidyl-prolyl cis-trans isomerase [Corallococcus sp. BB11-1]|uniref:peptidylprolyl isomerase n=1 Tax=Corallococcus sp. BB11-1 TaxID=2996783 RepID=UPI00226E8FCF|nr:peptidyl-prolyl cis-trans isomerase [Corallococcus sp. BB11-1]MCY1034317.1 peptidyl-prolyl cis-trans isomerase [Corallococcus sp. BB11-1]
MARFDGGVVTEEEVLRESQRLPPDLRKRFEQGPGRQEFIRSLVDKRLLFQEAARRGFTQDPDIRRQVRELEERLSIQALLAEEQKAAPAPTEAEARAFYQGHLERFAEPERLRMARAWVSVPAGSPRPVWEQARQRAEGLRKRLVAGEPVAKVAAAGDGPERSRGGEWGLLSRGEFGSADVEKAALALTRPGAVSPVVQDATGVGVLVLQERRSARVPPFEEVREAVLGQMAPVAQRRVFEQTLARLRAASSVKVSDGGAAVEDTVLKD